MVVITIAINSNHSSNKIIGVITREVMVAIKVNKTCLNNHSLISRTHSSLGIKETISTLLSSKTIGRIHTTSKIDTTSRIHIKNTQEWTQTHSIRIRVAHLLNSITNLSLRLTVEIILKITNKDLQTSWEIGDLKCLNLSTASLVKATDLAPSDLIEARSRSIRTTITTTIITTGVEHNTLWINADPTIQTKDKN